MSRPAYNLMQQGDRFAVLRQTGGKVEQLYWSENLPSTHNARPYRGEAVRFSNRGNADKLVELLHNHGEEDVNPATGRAIIGTSGVWREWVPTTAAGRPNHAMGGASV